MPGISIKNFANASGGVFYNGGVPYDANGALLVGGQGVFSQRPITCVIVGDSILGGGTATTTLAGLTSSGTTCTGTWTGSPVNLGGTIFISGANESAYNGFFTVTSTSGNNFTYTALSTPSATTATGTINATLQHRNNERNWVATANALMGWPIDKIYNAAVSGTTSAQCLSTFSRDVPGLTPDIVVIQTGTNDVYTDVAIATTQSNLRAIVAAVFAQGARPLLCTIPPRSDATATAARIAVANNLNAWIRYYAQTTPGVAFFDTFTYLVNPTSSTNAYITNYGASDNIHPSGLAGQVLGTPMQAVLADILPNAVLANRYVHAITDSVAITAGNRQWVTNPLMQGTGGTLAGGATGAFVPDNWTVTKTGAGATLAVTQDNPRSDGYGSNVIMTMTSTANNDAAALTSTSFHSNITAGDLVNYEVEVAISSITALSSLEISVDYTVGGTAYFWRANSTSGSNVHWGNNGTYIFRPCVPLTWPAGSTTNAQIRVQGTFTGAGGAVIKVARAAVRKLN